MGFNSAFKGLTRSLLNTRANLDLLTYLLTPWSRVLPEKLTSDFAYFVSGYVITSLETLSPGDPSGGVVYLRIVLSPEKG
jgi:hypothetical protein